MKFSRRGLAVIGIGVAALTVIGTGSAYAATAGSRAKPTCESIDIEVPVSIGMPGDYVLNLCGKDMPVASISCPQLPPHTGLPQPGSTLTCSVSLPKKKR